MFPCAGGVRHFLDSSLLTFQTVFIERHAVKQRALSLLTLGHKVIGTSTIDAFPARIGPQHGRSAQEDFFPPDNVIDHTAL
jgi:hypothetical protein